MAKPKTKARFTLPDLTFPCREQHGFSLIEVVVAMSIFAIGILATMQMGLLAQRNITSGNIVTSAVLLAQTELEKIKNHGSLIDLGDAFDSAKSAHGPFRISYTFHDPLSQEMDAPAQANCETGAWDGSGSCMAVVTVSWRRGGGGRGGKGQVQLTSLTHGRG